MANGWSEERRKKQAEAIRRHKPWEQSTGPRTQMGKSRAAMNALKHGTYTPEWTHIHRALNLNRAFVQHVAKFEAARIAIDQKLALVQGKRDLERTDG